MVQKRGIYLKHVLIFLRLVDNLESISEYVCERKTDTEREKD